MRFTAVALTALALLISQTAASPHPEPQGGLPIFVCMCCTSICNRQLTDAISTTNRQRVPGRDGSV
ncbi:hypothetical protein P691DRAFT_812577, partial [Macrolepiota fuliginosa MF-IS2]